MSQCLVCSWRFSGFHTATIGLATAQKFGPDARFASGPICCFAVAFLPLGSLAIPLRTSTLQTANCKLQTATANRQPLPLTGRRLELDRLPLGQGNQRYRPFPDQ